MRIKKSDFINGLEVDCCVDRHPPLGHISIRLSADGTEYEVYKRVMRLIRSPQNSDIVLEHGTLEKCVECSNRVCKLTDVVDHD